MQMLVHYSFDDESRFRAAFATDAEDRGQNGLSLLQLWREDGANAWALFDVRDVTAARDYLDGAAATFNAQAGVTATRRHLLETAQ